MILNPHVYFLIQVTLYFVNVNLKYRLAYHVKTFAYLQEQ